MFDSSQTVDNLSDDVSRLQQCDLSELRPTELLALIRRVEVLRRRLDSATDGLVDRCDSSGAHAADGHKSTKAAIKHLGRLSGPEAHGRVQTARALRELPAVAAAYAAGEIPTGVVRAIARVAANPRVHDLLSVADEVFVELARDDGHDAFCDWIREWESLADADGAAEAVDQGHRRRRGSLVRNEIDGTWHLEGGFGDLQGAAMADIFAAFVHAELEADRAWAREHIGEDFTHDQLPRTPAQRRADALFAIFGRAMAQPADARGPEPLVSIVIDDETLEGEIRRAMGDDVGSPEVEDVETDHTAETDRVPEPDEQHDTDGTAEPDENHDTEDTDGTAEPDEAEDVDEVLLARRPAPRRRGRRQAVCHTTSGHRLHPSAALSALLIGHVRRVVVDAASNVIDLGRRRRCFTGSSRDAAFVQALLHDPGGPGCFWPGCDTHFRHLQVDHRLARRRGGRTDVGNSWPCCGVHNRLKEHGFRPVREPDGTCVVLRPDGSRITPSA